MDISAGDLICPDTSCDLLSTRAMVRRSFEV